MISATGKIMSAVLEFWRSSPLTQVVDPQLLRVADLVRRDQVRTDRQELVHRLAEQPLAGPGLQIAHADVVRGAVAVDVVERVGLADVASRSCR